MLFPPSSVYSNLGLSIGIAPGIQTATKSLGDIKSLDGINPFSKINILSNPNPQVGLGNFPWHQARLRSLLELHQTAPNNNSRLNPHPRPHFRSVLHDGIWNPGLNKSGHFSEEGDEADDFNPSNESDLIATP